MSAAVHTEALLEALADLQQIQSEEKIFPFILNRVSEILKAQGGSYFSVHEDRGELYPEAAKGVSLSLLREVPFKMKLGISGWCATNRQSVRADNVQTDDRFNRAVDVITGIRTRSILCVPVLRKEKTYGVIELVNRVDGAFRDVDQEFLQFFAFQAAIALENCRIRRTTGDKLAYVSSLVDSLSSAVVATDLRGVVTVCNPSASRLLGVDGAEALGRPVAQVLSACPPLLTVFEAAQKRQSPAAHQEVRFKKQTGEAMILGYSTFVIRSEDHNHGIAVIFQDISSFAPGA